MLFVSRVSYSDFKAIIAQSLKDENGGLIDSLYKKLKDRLSDLLNKKKSNPSANATTNPPVVIDTTLNSQWNTCMLDRGLRIPKKAAR